MDHRKKEKKKKKEKEKRASTVSSNKRGSQYFERRKILYFNDPFYVIPFSPPLSYHFKNPFQNH
jgi:hypothetical protein